MEFDLDAAISFVATHGRVLDRRRLGLLLGTGSSEDVVVALDAYRNPDGGYGWALEPDQRSATSQSVAAMHALEILADVRDIKSRRPVQLCDWLSEQTLPDGGVPFGLPYSRHGGQRKALGRSRRDRVVLADDHTARRPGPPPRLVCPVERRQQTASALQQRELAGSIPVRSVQRQAIPDAECPETGLECCV